MKKAMISSQNESAFILGVVGRCSGRNQSFTDCVSPKKNVNHLHHIENFVHRMTKKLCITCASPVHYQKVAKKLMKIYCVRAKYFASDYTTKSSLSSTSSSGSVTRTGCSNASPSFASVMMDATAPSPRKSGEAVFS